MEEEKDLIDLRTTGHLPVSTLPMRPCSGAIVAAIVVVVIVIFTVVLTLLKMYNRKMRIRRELEPKGPKPAAPSALDPNSNSSQQPTAVTFGPADVHVETR
ncbi:noncompact myelin-associated protein isoform X3 [Marmota marmota marmota]|uniref:noncompact myelin-associated protein isoform X3 n=1 Tax=Marmota marmota marmota TaxID=9994 RepID=UPI00209400F7|nr:noncompact myelin-associated protein isoform X3 [Marmota marmota marmota]